MASLTQKRTSKIIAEQEAINKSVAQSISNLHRDLKRVMEFTAWANTSLLAADGDIDMDDMVIAKAEYDALAPQIRAFIPMLDSIETVDGIQANLDAFVAANGLDLAGYKTRFDG